MVCSVPEFGVVCDRPEFFSGCLTCECLPLQVVSHFEVAGAAALLEEEIREALVGTAGTAAGLAIHPCFLLLSCAENVPQLCHLIAIQAGISS